jgi:DNA-binding transcriptional LysR family regulator
MQGALFNLEAWKAFNMVAMKGSMNKAAAELLSDVSTVSRRIDALEKELGYPLFIRKARCCLLTREGERALKEIAPLLLQFSVSIQGLQDEGDAVQGIVNVNASAGLAQVLIPWLAEFQDRYPAVTVQLNLSTSPTTTNNKSDISIFCLQDGEAGPDDISLGKVPTYICASPAYLQSHRPIKNIDDLRNHRILINSLWMCPSLIYDPVAKAAYSHETGKRFRVNSMSALADAALAGVGVAIGLPEYLAREPLAAGRLVRLFAPMEALALHFWIRRPSAEAAPARIQLLIKFIEEKWKEFGPKSEPCGECCVLKSR